MRPLNLRKIIHNYLAIHDQKRSWHRVVTVLGCLVVFITTYAMILPAITVDAADLKQYLNDTGGSITAATDLEDTLAIPGTTYPLSLLITGGDNGFSPGIYFYKLPQSVHLKTLSGHDIISDSNEKIGSWFADENETIIFDFTEAAQIPGMQIDLELDISFDGTEESVTFDGSCQISIYIPPESPSDETTEPESSEETTTGSDPTEPEGSEEITPGNDPTEPEDSDDTELSQDYPIPYAELHDLKEYVADAGGTITVELFDGSGQKITDTVVAEEWYKLAFTVSLPQDKGFAPGTYTYQFPEGWSWYQ